MPRKSGVKLPGFLFEDAEATWRSEMKKIRASMETWDAQQEEFGQKRSVFLKRLSAFVGWDRMLPKDKTMVTLHVGLIILLAVCVDLLHGEQLTNESYSTMLGFLL